MNSISYIRSIPVLNCSCKSFPPFGLADSQDNGPQEATKNANAMKYLLLRISKTARKLKIRVTMKTSKSNPIGKAEHPVSLKIIFNFFTNSSRESEGSLSTWSFGSSGYDGCLSVGQKDSPKKCLLGQRESNWRIFPTIMAYCHLFISPLSNCLLYADSTTNLSRVYYLFSLKLVISCFTYVKIGYSGY